MNGFRSPGADGEAGTDAANMSLVDHLVELRTRMLRALAGVLLVFLALSPFANQLYTTLAMPMLAELGGGSMIATEVAAPFLVPFKLTLFVAVAASAPWLFYQIWLFVAPGLYLHERRLVGPLIASSTLLFYLGMAFAYFLVFPLVFAFFTSVAPEGVTVMTDISRYLDFVMKIFLAFGLAFEVPIATFVVVRSGLISASALATKRPYIIVAAFVLGMLLTPPDVVSQLLLAIPMWVLFEVGLLLARLLPGAR